jgi:hypothetical protein
VDLAGVLRTFPFDPIEAAWLDEKGVYGVGASDTHCRISYKKGRSLCFIGFQFAADVFSFWHWALGLWPLGSLDDSRLSIQLW